MGLTLLPDLWSISMASAGSNPRQQHIKNELSLYNFILSCLIGFIYSIKELLFGIGPSHFNPWVCIHLEPKGL